MNISRAIEKQILVLKQYCTTKEDREDIEPAIKALRFYESMHNYQETLERLRK